MGFLMDATDTYEKHISKPEACGLDKKYAEYIMTEYKKRNGKDLLSDEEIMRVIYLGAKMNSPKIDFSSSHRRLCQRELERDLLVPSTQPTIMNHLDFLEKGEIFNCKLGFARFSSEKFYKRLIDRWEKQNMLEGNFLFSAL